jgi:hypothetical protein
MSADAATCPTAAPTSGDLVDAFNCEAFENSDSCLPAGNVTGSYSREAKCVVVDDTGTPSYSVCDSYSTEKLCSGSDAKSGGCSWSSSASACLNACEADTAALDVYQLASIPSAASKSVPTATCSFSDVGTANECVLGQFTATSADSSPELDAGAACSACTSIECQTASHFWVVTPWVLKS